MAEAEFHQQVLGTSIDPTTFLSTDYFNLFNGVIMILALLPDQPDLLSEIEDWTFKTYPEHFDDSGLRISALAKEAYLRCPSDIKSRFDGLIDEMRLIVERAKQELPLLRAQDENRFAALALAASEKLQTRVVAGSGLINGAGAPSGQLAIDSLL